METYNRKKQKRRSRKGSVAQSWNVFSTLWKCQVESYFESLWIRKGLRFLVLPMLLISVNSPNLANQQWKGKKTAKCPNNFDWDSVLRLSWKTYNPGQKSLGQYCNIHIFLSFLGSLVKQCILFEILLQLPLPPPYTKLKLRNNSAYTRLTLFVELRERSDLCELENGPERQNVPRFLSMIVSLKLHTTVQPVFVSLKIGQDLDECETKPQVVTWDQALFSFRFVNNILGGKAKQKESLIQTFYKTSAAHFFDWLTFAEWADQNYFRFMFL